LNTAKTSLSVRTHAAYRSMTGVFVIAMALTPVAFAQTAPLADPSPLLLAKANLPDAPGIIPEPSTGSSSSLDGARPLALGESPQSTASYTTHARPLTLPIATNLDKYIAPGRSVPELSVGDKFALGLKDAFTPLSLVGWATAAGYQQALNGSPNYGTNSIAYGKRFGASVGRAVSEGIFSDSVMASVLHEDPRYYRMGSGNNVFKRVGYAVTRTLISRTDSGRATPNLALLGGNLGGSYLTKTYYPDLNTSNTEVLKTFGGSIGGSALGFAVNEFFGGLLDRIYHRDSN
jgi:hypothetical protein